MSDLGKIIQTLQSEREYYYQEADRLTMAGDDNLANIVDAKAHAMSEAIRIVIEGIN